MTNRSSSISKAPATNLATPILPTTDPPIDAIVAEPRNIYYDYLLAILQDEFDIFTTVNSLCRSMYVQSTSHHQHQCTCLLWSRLYRNGVECKGISTEIGTYERKSLEPDVSKLMWNNENIVHIWAQLNPPRSDVFITAAYVGRLFTRCLYATFCYVCICIQSQHQQHGNIINCVQKKKFTYTSSRPFPFVFYF